MPHFLQCVRSPPLIGRIYQSMKIGEPNTGKSGDAQTKFKYPLLLLFADIPLYLIFFHGVLYNNIDK